MQFQEDKCVYVTSGDEVLTVENDDPIRPCNHEEASTRVLKHLFQPFQHSSLWMVHYGDTDVVVICRYFHNIKAVNPTVYIWISFKAEKSIKLISLNIFFQIQG